MKNLTTTTKNQEIINLIRLNANLYYDRDTEIIPYAPLTFSHIKDIKKGIQTYCDDTGKKYYFKEIHK